MNKESAEALFKDFPNLYKNHQRCFEVGQGWEPLIRELSANLESLVLDIPEKDRELFKVCVVKEKFGGLRFECDYPYRYQHAIVKRFEAFISDAEEQSFETCERCGAPGVLRNTSWNHVHCDPCEDERLTKKRTG